MMALLAVGAAALSAAAVGALARLLVRPTPRLAPRLRPYTVASGTALGRRPDAATVAAVAGGAPMARAWTSASLVGGAAAVLQRLVDGRGEEALLLRIRQAGWYRDVPDAERAAEYRARQLGRTVAWVAGACAVGIATDRSAVVVLALAAAGFARGTTQARGALDRAIEERRLRMRLELATVNQLLALHVRVGGGVVQALAGVVQRGSGAVVDELAEVLSAHRSGRRIPDALEAAARMTPEPHAARTYRLLASGAEYGTDLGEALRSLAGDIRRERAEVLRRLATKRRAAMLVPIIAILAPVMLLFIAAPLPSIVFGGLGR